MPGIRCIAVNVIGEYPAEGLTYIASFRQEFRAQACACGDSHDSYRRSARVYRFQLVLRESQRLSGPKCREVAPPEGGLVWRPVFEHHISRDLAQLTNREPLQRKENWKREPGFAPDVRPGALPAGATPDPSAPPSIFTALREQLGLKLELKEAPVDVLVIDHIEEPSPN